MFASKSYTLVEQSHKTVPRRTRKGREFRGRYDERLSTRSAVLSNGDSVPFLFLHSKANLRPKAAFFCPLFVDTEFVMLHCSTIRCILWTFVVALLPLKHKTLFLFFFIEIIVHG